ncbi:MAG: carboxymuconolactone decarboxylase family protein [Betaproteobacteria bacterium]|nr:carboxymuconolactone decarboxylase family protein [Betaproteobacteria bacterium]
MSKSKKLDPAIKKRVQIGVRHFEETMGHLPVQMKTLSSNMPEVFAGYMDIRQWVMREPPEGAMPRKYKHLIFTLLDCVYNNGPGAENHARAALRRGLTVDELLEGMGQVLIVGGIGVYGTTGFRVLDNVLASAEGKAALKKKKQRGG